MRATNLLVRPNETAGQIIDAIFEWTGKGLGWDMYGHDPADDVPCSGDPTVCDALGLVCGPNGVCLEPDEDPDDHGKPLPVALPGQLEVTFGAAYSGSPYLGVMGDIPPGQGGLNFNAGYFYPWHSHHEKEVCNFDIFPGGMFTFLIIEPHGVPIP